MVFRHAGLNGLFVDVTAFGREGCWLSDCKKSDKFVCRSSADCAAACAGTEACKFWTYEPGITKCFLRVSDAGREEHPDFVSGARGCVPSGDAALPGTGGRLRMPFARAAIWAADLPAIRPCDGGIESPGCDNPYGAMNTWRYATNNLRLFVGGLPEEEKQAHRSTLQFVDQIASDVAQFYAQPTAEAFQVAVTNLITVFSALRGALQGAPATEVEIPDGPVAPSALPPGVALGGAKARLANGREMPLVGFGTWYLVGQEVYDATITALLSGYRHVDTAQAYSNEREVGLAIQHSGVPRGEIFLASKISETGEYRQLRARFEAQLAALGTEYLDLFMLHGYADRESNEAAWRTMEQLHDEGKILSLGVSNFNSGQLQELLSYARVKPVYVQNKFSVYNPGDQVIGKTSVMATCKEHGIQLVGYSTINSWPFYLPPLEDPHVQEVALRYGRTTSQVLHRWALQKGAAVIPRSAAAAHIQENSKLFDFELSPLDVRVLDSIVSLSETVPGRGVAPDWAEDVFGIGRL